MAFELFSYLFCGSMETFLYQMGVYTIIRKYESLLKSGFCPDICNELIYFAISQVL